MAALKARLEALEAIANTGSDLCHVELMTGDDPRATEPLAGNKTEQCVTRIVLVPLELPHLAGKGEIHGNA